MRTLTLAVATAALASTLSACNRTPTTPLEADARLPASPSASLHACQPSHVAPVLSLDNAGTAEGIAVSRRGDVFVGNALSGNGEIWRAPRGDFDETHLFADLPGGDLLGIDVDRFGNVYAAMVAFLDPDLHGLWKVEPNGEAHRAAALPPFFASLPNDVATDPRGNVYISDSFDGKIWRLTPDGELSAWIEDDFLRAYFGDVEFGVNGLVYHEWTLYAAITSNGRVVKIPIHPDGAAGSPKILVQDDALIGIDGIEPDARGNLYVTNNFTSTVQVIREDDLEIEMITGQGLSAPASLAFDVNQKVLYVANLSTSAGSPRPHAPALVQVTFSSPAVACNSHN